MKALADPSLIRIPLCILIVVVVASAELLSSGAGRGGGNAAAAAADENKMDDGLEVRTVAKQTARALEAGNTDALDGYLSSDYVFVDVAGNLMNKRARLKQIKEAGLKLANFDSDKQAIHFYDQTAVVTGLLDVKGTMTGRDITGRYRYVDVWVKREGKWTAIATTMSRVIADDTPAR